LIVNNINIAIVAMKLFRMQTLHSAENEHVALSKVSYSMPSKIIKQMTDDNTLLVI